MVVADFVKTVLLGIPVGITVLDTVGYVARVDGQSMRPALNPKSETSDYVFLSKISVRLSPIDRGDVVSFSSPRDPNQKLIKRVIGLEGDVVKTLSYRQKTVMVPAGHVWVEGDNAGNSMDSNAFGPVSLGLVHARASAVVWPPARWHWVASHLPLSRKPVNLPDHVA